jgi:hypothetical protein
MKRVLFNDLRLALAVLVLAAAAVDLMLPSPHCRGQGMEPEDVYGSASVPLACVASLPTTGNGLREP